MESLLINFKIAISLLLWIMAIFGFGSIFVIILNQFASFLKIDSGFKEAVDYKFSPLFKSLFGIFFICFISGFLNFFMPIDRIISLSFLATGLILFLYFSKNIYKNIQKEYVYAFICAFMIAAFLHYRMKMHLIRSTITYMQLSGYNKKK